MLIHQAASGARHPVRRNAALGGWATRTREWPVVQLCRGSPCGEKCRKHGEETAALFPRRDLRLAPIEEGAVAPPIVRRALDSPGRPLELATRAAMERGFGLDFSHVRVHADEVAEESSRAIRADAYTVANHMVFARNRYAPDIGAGRELIAHELTHVVQQGNRAAALPARLHVDMSAEGEANQSARRICEGSDAGALQSRGAIRLQGQFPFLEVPLELPLEVPLEVPMEVPLEVPPEIPIEEIGELPETGMPDGVPEGGMEELPEPITEPEAVEPGAEPEPVMEPGAEPGKAPAPAPGPHPFPIVGPQPEEVEEKPKECPPTVAPPPGPMPPKPPGIRVRLVLPSQKSAGDQFALYQRYLSVLEHDITRVPRRTAQARTWDQNVRPGGAHGMRPEKYREGRVLGIPRTRIFRPDWTKLNADVPTMHVDHIIELQLLPLGLRGSWGDTFDNYEILDQLSNTTSGRSIQINVGEERARLYALTCDPRWLTCRLRFDDLVQTPGSWTGARWSSQDIINGEQVDAWRRLHLGLPAAPPAVVPPLTPKPAAATPSKPPADFSSTFDVCFRLKSREFPIKNGGLKVTIGARWAGPPGSACKPEPYKVTLEKKRWLIPNKEIKTWMVPAGKLFLLPKSWLDPGDYDLIIEVPGAAGGCCLKGTLSVLTFDAPRPAPPARPQRPLPGRYPTGLTA